MLQSRPHGRVHADPTGAHTVADAGHCLLAKPDVEAWVIKRREFKESDAIKEISHIIEMHPGLYSKVLRP
jgi:hypothetical protein